MHGLHFYHKFLFFEVHWTTLFFFLFFSNDVLFSISNLISLSLDPCNNFMICRLLCPLVINYSFNSVSVKWPSEELEVFNFPNPLFLTLLQLEFFTTFKAMHRATPMLFSLFQALKPWFVCQLKIWNTCYCRYHTKLKELLHGLNEMQSLGNGIHTNCNCKFGEAYNGST